jgi:hypothetical protein
MSTSAGTVLNPSRRGARNEGCGIPNRMAASVASFEVSRRWRSATLERERRSVSAHREVLRGSDLPLPKEAPRGTLLHGFLLPFSLIAATLRHPTLGIAYLRITVVRTLLLGVLACVAFAAAQPLGMAHRVPRRTRGNGDPGVAPLTEPRTSLRW